MNSANKLPFWVCTEYTAVLQQRGRQISLSAVQTNIVHTDCTWILASCADSASDQHCIAVQMPVTVAHAADTSSRFNQSAFTTCPQRHQQLMQPKRCHNLSTAAAQHGGIVAQVPWNHMTSFTSSLTNVLHTSNKSTNCHVQPLQTQWLDGGVDGGLAVLTHVEGARQLVGGPLVATEARRLVREEVPVELPPANPKRHIYWTAGRPLVDTEARRLGFTACW